MAENTQMDNKEPKGEKVPESRETTREFDSRQETRSYINPHRCNGRLDDFIDALFDHQDEIGSRFALLWKCLRSDIGNEPTEPYLSGI